MSVPRAEITNTTVIEIATPRKRKQRVGSCRKYRGTTASAILICFLRDILIVENGTKVGVTNGLLILRH